jgi:alpha-galactosidase
MVPYIATLRVILIKVQDAGYHYVNIDDCWQVKDHRDNVTHRLIPDPVRFPDGIKGTADKIHEIGLKIGIYSSAGTKTCAGYPASIGYEDIDAATWAEWEIDYLKYDNCYIPQNWTDTCKGCVPENRPDLVNGTCKLSHTSSFLADKPCSMGNFKSLIAHFCQCASSEVPSRCAKLMCLG